MGKLESSAVFRMLLATGLAGLLSVSALPIMAKPQGASQPRAAETITVKPRELDPQLARLAADTGQAIVTGVNAALHHLSAGDTRLARAEVNKTLKLTGALEDILPYTMVVEKVEHAKKRTATETVRAFKDTLVPIYADIDEMQAYAPETASKAKKHLAEAREHINRGNREAAERSLQEVANDISVGAVYLPVDFVRSC
jgi:hypothetical protein